MGCDRHHPLAAVEDLGPLRLHAQGELVSELGSSDRDQFGVETAHLIREQLNIVSSRHSYDAEALREAADNVQGGRADRTGGAEDRDRFHGYPQLQTAVL